ncbi:hypothetical protein L9F63_013369 [Diploptera punctata]|uniref:Uncharacterized protein n=1 Tax=Diploptera punctata TaxID=6984 RepID=A0AAD8AAI4_DIPPU|nr:hypothetical protein L9F63_013369 [Diploptera punctata]
MNGPLTKRENSLDGMVDGERVVIRYVPKFRNDLSVVHYNNEDSDIPQTVNEEHERLIPLSEACPYCKSKYQNPHHHLHHDHHEDNADPFTSSHQGSIQENTPMPSLVEDISKNIEMETHQHNPVTKSYTRIEHPLPLVHTQNNMKHFAYFHDNPEEHLMEDITSPDLQYPGKRAKQLEFIMSSDGNENLEAIDKEVDHSVAREFIPASEMPMTMNLETLKEIEKEDSHNDSADIHDIFARSPVNAEGQLRLNIFK